MTSSKPSAYSREYLLRVYNACLEHGNVKLSPIDEETSRRFTQSFYRLRRRSDKSNAAFITPEMHLVTVVRWTPENGGTLHIVYNKETEGSPPLPDIIPGDGTPPPSPLPAMTSPHPDQLSSIDLDAANPAEDPAFDPDAYVQSLLSKAHKRRESADDAD